MALHPSIFIESSIEVWGDLRRRPIVGFYHGLRGTRNTRVVQVTLG